MHKSKRIKFFLTSLMVCTPLIPVETVFANDNTTAYFIGDNFFLSNPSANDANADSKLKNELRNLSYALSCNKYRNNDMEFEELLPAPGDNMDYLLDPYYFKSATAAKTNDDMKILDGEDLAAHSAYLNNFTEIDQTLSTASFTYTQEDSVSTETSHAAGVDISTTVEMNIPFVAGVSTTVSANYEYNNTNTITNTTTKKWEVPSQLIKVPAGRTYRVEWVLKTGVATGTTNLTSHVTADIPFRITDGLLYVYNLNDGINTQKRLVNTLPSSVSWEAQDDWMIDNNEAFRTWGTATYKAKCGTELIMNVMDVSKKSTAPVLIEKVHMKVLPIVLK